uniref:Uncharacterized protein n=1 Tax=Neobodo designis TaxID=312471 RepID=A0A7S1QZD8_NEODS
MSDRSGSEDGARRSPRGADSSTPVDLDASAPTVVGEAEAPVENAQDHCESHAATDATDEPEPDTMHRSSSKAVTISEPNRSASPSPPPAPLSREQSSPSSIDMLSQHRRSQEHALRKQAHIDRIREEEDRKHRAEETFKPYVSPYARQRVDRRLDDIVAANEEWQRQREMHIRKKQRQLKREEAAETAPRKHIDPRSERLCLLKGYDSIFSTPRRREEQESRERRRLQLEQASRPTFMPARYSHLTSRDDRGESPDVAPAFIPERSRSAAAQRLHNEWSERRARQQARCESAQQEREAAEVAARSKSAASVLRRGPVTSRRFAERLEEWKRQRDARLQLRQAEAQSDPEASFHPAVSKRSAELASVHRALRGSTYTRETACAAAHHQPKYNHKAAKAPNVVKCAPLPASFWTRNQRHQAAKQQRAAQVREQIDTRNKEHCTFAPKISAVSDAIMQQLHTLRPTAASGPTFMQPTESAVRHAVDPDTVATHSPIVQPPAEAESRQHARAFDTAHEKPVAAATPPPQRPSSVGSPDAGLESRMAEMRATLEQWNLLADIGQ